MRGEIWTMRDDLYASKARPVVIVQSDDIAGFDSIVLCLLTTYDNADTPTRVRVEPSAANGLERTSFDFRDVLELDGAAALDRFDWADGFSVLGFKMDCGASYEERFRLVLGDEDDIEGALSRVDDPLVLGNAIFSQCRYLTHWSGGFGEEATAWLIAALAK